MAGMHEGEATSGWRADIDGLRALAILAVMGFHYLPGLLRSGFAGVDVFFVISGYLITGILLSARARGTYSLLDFYAARVRRIFPALVLVLAAVMAASLFCFHAEERELLGAQLLAGAAFVANLQLWGEAGYFDAAIGTKPLAHLWSLGVEEQFYLVWPLVLGLLAGRRRSRLTVAVLAAASCAAGAWVVQRDQPMAFYVPVFRIWEPMVGAWLALAERDGLAARWRPHADRLSLAGFALLALAFGLLDPRLAFPGAWALLPVAGAAFVIAAGPAARLNRLLLANRAMVVIGLISYPLYLWHWPLLVFVHAVLNSELQPGGALALLALTFLLAWLTYRFVETPIRTQGHRLPKTWGLAAAMVMLALVAPRLGDLPGTLAPDAGIRAMPAPPGYQLARDSDLVEGCGLLEPGARRLVLQCLSDRREEPTLALLGDSKAEALFDGLVRTSMPGSRWLFVGGAQQHASVIPVLSGRPEYARHQPGTQAALDAVTHNPRIGTVALVAATRSLYQLPLDDSLEGLAASPNRDTAHDGMRRFVEALLHAGKKIVLVVDTPTLADPRKCLAPARYALPAMLHGWFAAQAPHCELTVEQHRLLSAPYLQMLQEVRQLAPDRITIVDGTSRLCDMRGGVCRLADAEGILYSYTDHISGLAAARIGAVLNAQLAGRLAAGRD